MIGVQVLGGAIITCGEHRFSDSGARRFAVALYLAAERGRRLDRGATQELLFGDLPEASAAHTFRQYLYKLGTYGWPIRADRSELFLPADAVRSDFDAVIEADRLTPEQLTAIQAGVLPGAFSPELPRFNEWVDEYRARIERELQRALVRHLGSAREVGDWTLAERTARACLALDPLNEEATLALAESLAIAGSKAAAMKVLDEYTREVGASGGDLKIPANVLRRRIAERLPDMPYRSRGELPFVGRHEEMRLLADRLRKARAGEGQCILIHGEPGIGKTRLAAEFANIAVLDGARVARVASQPHDVHRPLAAFVDLVPLLLELPGALGCSPDSMEALRRLTGRETAADARDATEMDPETRYHRTTTAIRDVIDAVTAECLLAVVIEDAHWLDPLSLQFIGGLIAQRSDRRLLLVITSRERDAVIQHARHADRMTIVHLEALTAEATSELASVALAATGTDRPAELVQRIHQTAGGNPLFVVSLAEHWRDASSRYAVPSSMTSLIEYQVQRLSRSGLTALHTIILLGRYSTGPRLSACLQVDTLSLADALQELEDRSLVRSDESSIVTRHALIAETTLNRAPRSKLSALHARVATVLEGEAAGDGAVQFLWEAAEHWNAAGFGDRAYEVLERCAEAAARIGRPAEASDILARAARVTSRVDRRIAAVSRAALLAGEATEDARTLALTALLRELGGQVSPQLGIMELVAMLHADTEPRTVPARIEAVLAENDSDAVLGQAATVMLKAADRLRDHAVAVRGIELRDACHTLSKLQRLEFDLIYEVSFGDMARAAVAAFGIIAESEDLPMSSSRIGRRHNAAQGLWHTGYWAEATHFMEESYKASLQRGLMRQSLASAIEMEHMERELGHAEAAAIWSVRVHTAAEERQVGRGMGVIVLDGLEAWTRRDAAALRSVGEAILARVSANSVRTTTIWGHAFTAAAAHLSGSTAPTDTIREISLPLPKLRGFGADDLLVTILATDRRLRGEITDACALLAEYIRRYRVSLSPLWIGLRDVVADLGSEQSEWLNQLTTRNVSRAGEPENSPATTPIIG